MAQLFNAAKDSKSVSSDYLWAKGQIEAAKVSRDPDMAVRMAFAGLEKLKKPSKDDDLVEYYLLDAYAQKICGNLNEAIRSFKESFNKYKQLNKKNPEIIHVVELLNLQLAVGKRDDDMGLFAKVEETADTCLKALENNQSAPAKILTQNLRKIKEETHEGRQKNLRLANEHREAGRLEEAVQSFEQYKKDVDQRPEIEHVVVFLSVQLAIAENGKDKSKNKKLITEVEETALKCVRVLKDDTSKKAEILKKSLGDIQDRILAASIKESSASSLPFAVSKSEVKKAKNTSELSLFRLKAEAQSAVDQPRKEKDTVQLSIEQDYPIPPPLDDEIESLSLPPAPPSASPVHKPKENPFKEILESKLIQEDEMRVRVEKIAQQIKGLVSKWDRDRAKREGGDKLSLVDLSLLWKLKKACEKMLILLEEFPASAAKEYAHRKLDAANGKIGKHRKGLIHNSFEAVTQEFFQDLYHAYTSGSQPRKAVLVKKYKDRISAHLEFFKLDFLKHEVSTATIKWVHLQVAQAHYFLQKIEQPVIIPGEFYQELQYLIDCEKAAEDVDVAFFRTLMYCHLAEVERNKSPRDDKTLQSLENNALVHFAKLEDFFERNELEHIKRPSFYYYQKAQLLAQLDKNDELEIIRLCNQFLYAIPVQEEAPSDTKRAPPGKDDMIPMNKAYEYEICLLKARMCFRLKLWKNAENAFNRAMQINAVFQLEVPLSSDDEYQAVKAQIEVAKLLALTKPDVAKGKAMAVLERLIKIKDKIDPKEYYLLRAYAFKISGQDSEASKRFAQYFTLARDKAEIEHVAALARLQIDKGIKEEKQSVIKQVKADAERYLDILKNPKNNKEIALKDLWEKIYDDATAALLDLTGRSKTTTASLLAPAPVVSKNPLQPATPERRKGRLHLDKPPHPAFQSEAEVVPSPAVSQSLSTVAWIKRKLQEIKKTPPTGLSKATAEAATAPMSPQQSGSRARMGSGSPVKDLELSFFGSTNSEGSSASSSAASSQSVTAAPGEADPIRPSSLIPIPGNGTS